MEINPEVFVRLAEDTTYKLWELANVCVLFLNRFKYMHNKVPFLDFENIYSSFRWSSYNRHCQ